MPRLSHATPRLCRVRNRAVVYLAGEAHYLGRHGSAEAKQRYRQLLLKWEADDRPTRPTPSPADITVAELCLAYKRHAFAYYRLPDGSLSGEIHPIKAAIKLLRTYWGTMPAATIGPREFRALREKFIEEGLTRSTVNRYASRVKRIFNWAISEVILPSVLQPVYRVAQIASANLASMEAVTERI